MHFHEHLMKARDALAFAVDDLNECSNLGDPIEHVIVMERFIEAAELQRKLDCLVDAWEAKHND